MKRLWKLLPVAALSALGLLVLMPGGGARPDHVSAVVSSVVISADDVASGGNVNVSITAEQGDLPVSVSLTGAAGGTTHTFTLTDCGGCDDEDDSGTGLSINASAGAGFPANGQIVVRLTISCTSPDTVSVIATQGGVGSADAVDCNPSTTPTVAPTTTGTPSTATPTITTTPAGADTITLSAVQPNPQCGQAVFLFATVKNAAGGFVPGATVTFSASGGLGSFSPVSAVTVTDGVASSTYTPPTTGNQTVTITATTGGKTATATVPVNCGSAATATPVPATPQVISPPSTGDAGLADDSSLLFYAGLATLAGVAFTGAFVAARRRA